MPPHVPAALLMAVVMVLTSARATDTAVRCPKLCECNVTPYPVTEGHAVSLVNCSHRGLHHFPQDIINTTQVLLLSHNGLQNLSHLPPLPALRLLDLSHNRISFLDNHWLFEHMPLLTELDLSHNSLATLQHGSFSGLQSVEVLRLSHNKIRMVQLHAFGGLNQLHALHLGHNDLYQLRRPWLLAMTSLRELYLQHNHISLVEARTFDRHGSLLHLDLSDNGLKRVQDEGFVGLTGVKVLNLSNNALQSPPTKELQRLVSLDILLLDGIPAPSLQGGALAHLSVSSLSLSYLPALTVVHRAAFANLTRLHTLQLHNNPTLIFIHPGAFEGTPLLHSLLVHNNQLVTLGVGIKASLPSLDELHVYHNPLHCDCNILWLRRDLLATATHNDSDVTSYIKKPSLLTCNTPDLNASMPLVQVPLHLLPPVCAPTTLPLFFDSVNASLGDTVRLECQVMGVPQPTLSWILPDGARVNGSTDSVSSVSDSTARTSYDHGTDSWLPDSETQSGPGTVSSPPAQLSDHGTVSSQATVPSLHSIVSSQPVVVSVHSAVSPHGANKQSSPALSTVTGLASHGPEGSSVSVSVDNTVLTLHGAQPRDQGTYVCQASNVAGTDTSSTALHVHNKQLRLMVTEVANTYITVAWVGAIPRTQISHFQIYYRPSQDHADFHKVYLHGSMHTCRLAGLQPLTSYQICIVYRDTYPVQCANFSTDHRVAVYDSGIRRVNLAGVVASTCSVLAILGLLCVGRVMLRKVRKRKEYTDPLTDGTDADKIPLEPLHPPPGTPLCSSRTALLPHSQI